MPVSVISNGANAPDVLDLDLSPDLQVLIETSRPFIRSRPLNVHRWADYPELNSCLNQLIAEIEAYEGRQRQRSGNTAKHFREAVRVLVLDLYVAWKTAPDLQVGIDLNANRFSEHSRYDNLFLAYRPFHAAFKGLRDLGYLQVDKRGCYDGAKKTGYNTKVRATDKLITLLKGKARIQPYHVTRSLNAETIILRDETGKKIDYEDTEATRQMRQNLKAINQVLLNYWVDLEITDEQFTQLQERLRQKATWDDEKPMIDFSRRTLVRIFNNSSFEEGGRFYRGWWQNAPKEYRKYITINGRRAVELDYSGLHPRILYALERQEMPDDPYDIGLGQKYRDLIKRTLNAIINAGSKGVAEPKGYDAERIGMPWAEFQERVKNTHHSIAQYFNTGYGLRLQYIDSCIAEAVMLHFAQKNIPCLPVHDSFIMYHGYESELDNEMQKAFHQAVGGRVKIKPTMTEIPGRGQNTGSVMNGVLVPHLPDAFQGYKQRLTAWANRDR